MNISSEPAALPEWQAIVSGNAQLSLSPVLAGRTAALRMDFDFKGGGGFVVARRAFKRAMPEEYCVKFRLRGSGAVNHLELKLVDATGQNVWRHVYRDLRPPPRWKSMTLDSRDIEFAWGPSSGGRIAALGSMEFAIVAGEGGKGTLWIAGVEIEDRGPHAAPTASASSELPDFAASAALSGRGWKPRPDDPHPWITIDSIQPRTIGGLVIDWLEQAPAKGFRIRGSNSGTSLEDPACCNPRRRQTQLRVFARHQGSIPAAGSRAAHCGRRPAAADIRVLPLHPRLLAQRRRRRNARLASSLAAQ